MSFLNLPRFGTGIGLHRTGFLLDALEIDRQWLAQTSVNVTGTNGKGSTAESCNRIAQAHGLKTGLFTSPHMYRVTERFQIDSAEVTDAQLDESLGRARDAMAEYQSKFPDQEFAGFEVLFAAAADIFSRAGCEHCVFEAGIGGRYDPVRMTGSCSAVVASLDYDHTALLGSTLELICLDKTDICANGGRVFYGTSCIPQRNAAQEYCRLRGIEAAFLDSSLGFHVNQVSSEGTEFCLRIGSRPADRFFTPLIGEHQANNAALSLLLFENWCRKAGREFAAQKAKAGLREVRWPGRLETISEDPLTVIDSASSPDGVRAALRALRQAYASREFVLVTGSSKDKDVSTMLSLLAPHFRQIVCTQAHKGRDPAEIRAIAQQLNRSATVETAPTMAHAIELSRSLAKDRSAGVYVAGGGYIAAEFALATHGGDPHSIRYLS